MVPVRKGEGMKAFLMFLYFFLTIASYYIIKPVRDSLFLTRFGAENLPYVWLATIFVLSGIVSVYVRFAGKLKKNVLLSSTVLFFICNLAVFWWLAGTGWHWLAAVFYVWVSIFSIMVVTQFWLFTNDIFNPREAKRLFGFVGSGGILGGFTGGLITSRAVMLVGTRNLLLVAAAILLFCVGLINYIWHREMKGRTEESSPAPRKENAERTGQETRRILKIIRTTKYLLILAGLVCLAKMVSTLIEYQFKTIVQAQIQGLDMRTAFFGRFFALLNAASFTMQFFFTSRILRKFGVSAALFLLPFGLMIGGLALLFNPVLWIAAFTMMYDGSLNYSLNQSTKEVLYLPIARELRYKVKPFIDMLAYRTAKAASSIIILLFTAVLHLDMVYIGGVTIGLIAAWLVSIWKMRSEYVNELRRSLASGQQRTAGEPAGSSEELAVRSFLDTIAGPGERKRAIVAYMGIAREPGAVERLEELSAGGDPPRLIREVERLAVAGKGGADLEVRSLLEKWRLDEVISCLAMLSAEDPESGHLQPFTDTETGADQKIVLLLYRLRMFPGNAVMDELRSALRKKKAEGALPAGMDTPDAEKAREGAIPRDLVSCARGDGCRREDVRDIVGNDRIAALKVLERLIGDASLPPKVRKNLISFTQHIPENETVDMLLKSLHGRTPETRYEIIKSLDNIRISRPDLRFDRKRVIAEIEKELRSYENSVNTFEICSGLHEQLIRSDGEGGNTDLFLDAQRSRIHEVLKRIFRLLGLICEPADMRTIYSSFIQGDTRVRAHAIELLDSVIDLRLRGTLHSLLELERTSFSADDLPGGERIKDMTDPFPMLNRMSRNGDDGWGRISALYIMTRARAEGALSGMSFRAA